jgi:hypothetical protein
MKQPVPVETLVVLLKSLGQAKTHVEQTARPQAQPQAEPRVELQAKLQAVRLERLAAQVEQLVPAEAHVQQLAELTVKTRPTPVE